MKYLKDHQKSVEIMKSQKKVGNLKFNEVKFYNRNTFLEYVFGGCEISLTIAIDFTLSNGNPTDP